MKKLSLLGIFLFLISFAPAQASVNADFLNNGAPAGNFYQSFFDILVLDVTIPSNNGAVDELNALTIKNQGTAQNLNNIEKVVIWKDAGPAGFQGLGIDQKLGMAVWYDLDQYWYLKDLQEPISAEGLRIFVTVETAPSLNKTSFAQMMIPALDDKNANGQFDLRDAGIFVSSNNDGPTDSALVNQNQQTLYKASFDQYAPKSNITNLANGQTVVAGNFIIQGQSRDQGGSIMDWTKVVIDGEEFDVETSDNYANWQYSVNFSAGSHTISVKSRDQVGNEGESDAFTITAEEPVVFSAVNSTVEASVHNVAANGSSVATITVVAKNSKGEAMSGQTVALASSRAAEDIIQPASAVSDENGKAEFVVAANIAGESIFTASVDGETIAQTPKIYFFSLPEGNLIKGESSSAVYLLKFDNKRYVFPYQSVYESYYGASFAAVDAISDETLAFYSLGGNMTYAPGSLIKIPSIPKVYAVSAGGIIHWIKTEEAARKYFGAGWSSLVHDVSESFFMDYQEGESIM